MLSAGIAEYITQLCIILYSLRQGTTGPSSRTSGLFKWDSTRLSEEYPPLLSLKIERPWLLNRSKEILSSALLLYVLDYLRTKTPEFWTTITPPRYQSGSVVLPKFFQWPILVVPHLGPALAGAVPLIHRYDPFLIKRSPFIEKQSVGPELENTINVILVFRMHALRFSGPLSMGLWKFVTVFP